MKEIVIYNNHPDNVLLNNDLYTLIDVIKKYSLKDIGVRLVNNFYQGHGKIINNNLKSVFLFSSRINDLINDDNDLKKFLRTLKNVKKIFLMEDTINSLNTLLRLYNSNRKAIDFLSYFDYVLVKIDPSVFPGLVKKMSKIKRVNFIYTGFIEREKPKIEDRYVDVNGTVRIFKFINQIFFSKKLFSPVGKPFKAMLEICRVCNLKCPSCPIGCGDAKMYPMMDFFDYKRIIDLICDTIADLSLFNYGEPLIHPRLIDMITYAKEKGLNIVKFSSNGLLLTPTLSNALIKSGLDKIRFSVDAASSVVYNKYRIGGDFKKLIANIRQLCKIKDKLSVTTPIVEAQFIVMRHNEHEIYSFYKLMKDLGVDEVKYKTFNAYFAGYRNKNNNLEFLPSKKEYNRYVDFQASRVKGTRRLNICDWPYEWLVVNAEREIAPCCHDYNTKNKLGDFNRDNVWWNTEERLNFQVKLKNNPQKIEICKRCPKGALDLSVDDLDLF